MPSKLLDFYHEKEGSEPEHLTKQELDDRAADEEDYLNQKKERDSHLDMWRWSGSVYNVVKSAQPDDRISQITLGWIRSYIDTGIAQMTAGEPEFDYEALGPSDESRTLLWKKMVETTMSRCGFSAHQKVAMTDSHVFGPGVFEVYQQRPYRTVRVPQLDGTMKDRVIIDNRRPRVGVRAISPFRCTRNPNVSDPNEVGSCTKEEILSWNQFVQNYGRCNDRDGKPKFKNIDQISKGSHVKVTVYQDEIRDVYRIYALSYGSQNDGMTDIPPAGLGIPIFDRPLKIHDIYDKSGEIARSLGLNIPGMCNLVFLPYADKYTPDYETHNIYGMGLPEHMEGLDTFMQTAFNMTVDNWRMSSTFLIDYQSRDGTIPDFDANSYYGGEYVNAQINVQSLGKENTVSFDNMYEVIQKMSIPSTGININQIAGDTSKTAFEFAQRIEANNKRTEMRLKEWESGPLKRLGTLLLSACLSELTVNDVESIRAGDTEKVLADIAAGRATRDDYNFENGKPIEKKSYFYIDMKGMKEDFQKPRASTRTLSVDSTENTLIPDVANPNAIHKIAITNKYVYPDWYVESGILFDTKVDSKRMITNKKIRDSQALQSVINNFLQLLQVDPNFAKDVDVSKLFEKILNLADIETDDLLKSKDQNTETADVLKLLKQQKDQILNTPPQQNAVPPQVNTQQPGGVGQGQVDPASLEQGPEARSLQSMLGNSPNGL